MGETSITWLRATHGAGQYKSVGQWNAGPGKHTARHAVGS